MRVCFVYNSIFIIAQLTQILNNRRIFFFLCLIYLNFFNIILSHFLKDLKSDPYQNETDLYTGLYHQANCTHSKIHNTCHDLKIPREKTGPVQVHETGQLQGEEEGRLEGKETR